MSLLPLLHLSWLSSCFCFLQIKGKMVLVNKKTKQNYSVSLRLLGSEKNVCERWNTCLRQRSVAVGPQKVFLNPKRYFSKLPLWKKIWLLKAYLKQYFNIILKLIIITSTSWANSLYPRIGIHPSSLLLWKIRYLVRISHLGSIHSHWDSSQPETGARG